MRLSRRRALLLASILIGSIGAIEAVLRFGLGLGHPVLITPDPSCAYILKPDQHIFRFFCHTDINRYGMRSGDVPNRRSPHSLRIMFVGDSITYGTSHLDQSRIFSELVHRELPGIVHEPVEVLNASASAWAIDNELSYVRSRGIFGSDVVLLVLNSGDLEQPRATIADVGDELPAKPEATAIGELFDRFIIPRILRIYARTDAGDTVGSSADSVKNQNLADLDAFHSLVEEGHASMAVIYAPFARDIPQDSAPSAAALRQWASANRVPLLDLTAVESQYSPADITLGDGEHFNARGNRIVATAIEAAWPQLRPAQ